MFGIRKRANAIERFNGRNPMCAHAVHELMTKISAGQIGWSADFEKPSISSFLDEQFIHWSGMSDMIRIDSGGDVAPCIRQCEAELMHCSYDYLPNLPTEMDGFMIACGITRMIVFSMAPGISDGDPSVTRDATLKILWDLKEKLRKSSFDKFMYGAGKCFYLVGAAIDSASWRDLNGMERKRRVAEWEFGYE